MSVSNSYHMSDAEASREFNHFFNEKLRPVIDAVALRRRRAFLFSLVVALVCFGVFALVLHIYLAPKFEMLKTHNITFWPLFLLLPATLALLVFSVTYIFALRNVVAEFKASMFGRMAEFIHPNMIYERGQGIPGAEMTASLLFEGLGIPVASPDRFRGGLGSARVEFAPVRVERPEGNGGTRVLSGIYYSVSYGGTFKSPLIVLPILAPASLSRIQRDLTARGLAKPGDLIRIEDIPEKRQAVVYAADEDEAWRVLTPDLKIRLAVLRNRRGVELHLSCLGNRLALALLGPEADEERRGSFDDFDFVNFREFCRDARVCLELTGELEREREVWR